MITVHLDKRLQKQVDKYSKAEKARIDRVRELFRDSGFSLTEVHLKRLTKIIWELRAGKLRLLFGMVKNEAIVVSIFQKKTKKTPEKEIKLAERRIREYL